MAMSAEHRLKFAALERDEKPQKRRYTNSIKCLPNCCRGTRKKHLSMNGKL